MAEQSSNRRNLVRLAALAVVAIGALAIYVSLDAERNTADAACRDASTRAASLDQFAIGQLAGFRPASDSTSLAELSFQTPNGDELSIASFVGRVVLLNLWATWCAPCREEMPALNQLEAFLGGESFKILAVSVDTNNTPQGPQDFFADFEIDELDLYVDPSTWILADLRGIGARGGLPTTILLDEIGCILGIIEGPADWAGPDAVALIGAALAEPRR